MATQNASRSKKSKQTQRSINWSKRPRQQRLSNNIDGTAVRVPDDPPSTVIQPWNSVTVVLSRKVTGGKDYLWLGDIVSGLRAQLDGSGLMFNQRKASVGTWTATDFQVDLKLDWVHAWGLDGRNIVVNFWDPTSSSHNDPEGKAVPMQVANLLNTLYDTGTQSRNPRLGYKYPERVRNSPFTVGDLSEDKLKCNWNDDTARLFLSYQSFQGKTILFHIRIHYRPPGMGKVTFTRDMQEEILNEVSESSGHSLRMAETLEKLNGLLSDIKSSQPSTIEKVVNKVKLAAMVVAPFVGDTEEVEVGEECDDEGSSFSSLAN